MITYWKGCYENYGMKHLRSSRETWLRNRELLHKPSVALLCLKCFRQLSGLEKHLTAPCNHFHIRVKIFFENIRLWSIFFSPKRTKHDNSFSISRLICNNLQHSCFPYLKTHLKYLYTFSKRIYFNFSIPNIIIMHYISILVSLSSLLCIKQWWILSV